MEEALAAKQVDAGTTGGSTVQGVISAADYERFCRFLEKASGITLGENKDYLIRSRLSRIIQEFGLPGLGELVTRLENNSLPGLRARIIDAMTTNETLWFRDVHPFEVFQEEVLPAFSGPRNQPVRIWSAACSSGQEPYSISMVINEYQERFPGRLPAGAQIVATDISPTMLKQARAGVYDEMELARGLGPERRRKFFTHANGVATVRDDIRRRVQFMELNLLQSYALLGLFDVIFCRNVLIYFSQENKRDILARMAKSLRPGGFLFLGGSEPIANYSREFEMVRCTRGVVYRLIRR